ncbi:hypothetical protein JB92DRAFT_3224883 [Gautieria morchelliformis]|nr:hypothetical protein JB92DRAFT_3224883 [Gautieria morchelliformis]
MLQAFQKSDTQELSKVNLESPSHLAEFLGYDDAGKLPGWKNFVDDVISEASKIERHIQPQTPPLAGKDSPSVPLLDKSVHQTLVPAVKALIEKLPSQGPLNNKLILGFDESSDLADLTKDWDAFEKIRRVFRYLREWPIFGVFLSTTGLVKQFHPVSRWDKSSRIQDGTLYLFPPITLVGYDQLAIKLKQGNTLDDGTTIDFMLSLGRPLFKTQYDAMKSLAIVHFATHKLLNGPDKPFELSSSIAPLAIWLPLEFNALTDAGREAEQQQVESHMRICLKIDLVVDVMYTVAPSEPVLIEAAVQTMEAHEGNPTTCATFSQTFLHTKHKATVLDTQAYEDGPFLQKVFKDSWTHCMHFVKVTDHKVINCKFLMRLMACGAGILCANNQLGIDAIIPVCYKGKDLPWLWPGSPRLWLAKNLSQAISTWPGLARAWPWLGPWPVAYQKVLKLFLIINDIIGAVLSPAPVFLGMTQRCTGFHHTSGACDCDACPGPSRAEHNPTVRTLGAVGGGMDIDASSMDEEDGERGEGENEKTGKREHAVIRKKLEVSRTQRSSMVWVSGTFLIVRGARNATLGFTTRPVLVTVGAVNCLNFVIRISNVRAGHSKWVVKSHSFLARLWPGKTRAGPWSQLRQRLWESNPAIHMVSMDTSMDVSMDLVTLR